MKRRDNIQAVEAVVGCEDVNATLAFFLDRLGFRVESISPADDPVSAVVSGHGARVRLESGGGARGTLRIACVDPDAVADGARELLAPNGTRIELAAADPPLSIPPLAPELVVSRMDDAEWVHGRAGMRYRDLIPRRQGGRFVASHIRIVEGGAVPDYVHYHRVRFQMIYVVSGWVRVVYEDQGASFVMQAGDCVVQPPRIRHRVLECSAGLEVVEVGCPALHDTFADHDLALPTETERPERRFSDQRFIRHVAADAVFRPWRIDGFRARDTGIAEATGGLASVQVARVLSAGGATAACTHDAELLFWFILSGDVELSLDAGRVLCCSRGDAVTLPAGLRHAVTSTSSDLELLEVALPASLRTSRIAEPK